MTESDQADGMTESTMTTKTVKRCNRCCCNLLHVTTATLLIGCLELCYFSYEVWMSLNNNKKFDQSFSKMLLLIDWKRKKNFFFFLNYLLSIGSNLDLFNNIPFCSNGWTISSFIIHIIIWYTSCIYCFSFTFCCYQNNNTIFTGTTFTNAGNI